MKLFLLAIFGIAMAHLEGVVVLYYCYPGYLSVI